MGLVTTVHVAERFPPERSATRQNPHLWVQFAIEAGYLQKYPW
jgi:hypothetical protein